MVIAVTDRRSCEGDFLAQIEKLSLGGAEKIILREKDLSDEEYIILAEKCLEICGGLLYVNSRINAAKALGIKRLHLPYGLFVSNGGRKGLSGFETIGVSVHSAEEAEICETMGADYLIGGHIFPTDCKKGLPPKGCGYISDIARRVGIPVYAIGGINTENAAYLAGSGISGVCLMSGLMKVLRPKEIIEKLNTINF